MRKQEVYDLESVNYSSSDVKLSEDEKTLMILLDHERTNYLDGIIYELGKDKGWSGREYGWIIKKEKRKPIPNKEIEINLIRLCIKGLAEVNATKGGDYFTITKNGRIWCRYNLDGDFKPSQKCWICQTDVITCIIKGTQNPEDVFCNRCTEEMHLIDEIRSARHHYEMAKESVVICKRELEEAKEKHEKWRKENPIGI